LSGLGRIQKRIRRAFLAHPDRLYRTVELVRWAYPRLTGEIEDWHRGNICRAAETVAVRVRRDRPGGVVWAAAQCTENPL
jgi:hypothetical protein